jgi:hypothetical protein
VAWSDHQAEKRQNEGLEARKPDTKVLLLLLLHILFYFLQCGDEPRALSMPGKPSVADTVLTP